MKHEFRTFLGCSFEYDGIRHACYQMVSLKDGKAYAIADFEGGQLVRFLQSQRFINAANKFKQGVCLLEASGSKLESTCHKAQ